MRKEDGRLCGWTLTPLFFPGCLLIIREFLYLVVRGRWNYSADKM